MPASSSLTSGTRTFSATLTTAGSQTLVTSDATTIGITGQSGPITVSTATATHFAVAASGLATAGTGFTFAVTALDPWGNTAKGYGGTVVFACSDATATVQVNSTLSDGTGTFSATLTTVGNQTLTATDETVSSITGHSGAITVSAAAATHFAVVAPSSTTAGSGFAFTVTALDPFNNTATGYASSIVLSSSDIGATVPVNTTNSNGIGTFSATLTTAGKQTLIATDATTISITGQSGPITVDAAAATHFAVAAPGTGSAGSGFSITVTALDRFNNTATGYAGSVVLTSTDAGATVPPSSTLGSGTATFRQPLTTAGSQTLIANDATSFTISGQSGPIAVNAASATHFAVGTAAATTAGSPLTFTVTGIRPI